MADLLITADTGISYAVARGVLTQSPAAARNTSLDLTFDCEDTDNDGIATALATAYGSLPFAPYVATGTVVASAFGSEILSLCVYDGSGTIVATAYGEILLEGSKKNWLKWSNIGALDFTIWRDNVAGERPMDWKGWVYAARKLGGRVVVYGENGVSLMVPAGNAWGLQTIHTLGLAGKQAVTGNDSGHWFIDREGVLYSLGEEMAKLGYSEYLSTLINPVMSYDNENGLVYICDGLTGYIYNPEDKSLGEGPANITGIYAQGGTLYVVSPAAIVTPAFEICTDIYDFGTRTGKTIRSVELGAALSGALSLAIDYRKNKAAAFSTTPYRTVNREGVAFLTCYGYEFRFRVKSAAYEAFSLDYITINGEVHDH